MNANLRQGHESEQAVGWSRAAQDAAESRTVAGDENVAPAPFLKRQIGYGTMGALFITVFVLLLIGLALLVMGTSIGSLVGVDELTGQAFNISTENYRWLEMFTLVGGIYVVLTFVASLSLALVGRWAFRVKAKVF